jgi:hypothetical protein
VAARASCVVCLRALISKECRLLLPPLPVTQITGLTGLHQLCMQSAVYESSGHAVLQQLTSLRSSGELRAPCLPQLTFLRSLALESDALECSQLGAALRQLTLLTHLEV